jgi:hypothetical protein
VYRPVPDIQVVDAGFRILLAVVGVGLLVSAATTWQRRFCGGMHSVEPVLVSVVGVLAASELLLIRPVLTGALAAAALGYACHVSVRTRRGAAARAVERLQVAAVAVRAVAARMIGRMSRR